MPTPKEKEAQLKLQMNIARLEGTTAQLGHAITELQETYTDLLQKGDYRVVLGPELRQKLYQQLVDHQTRLATAISLLDKAKSQVNDARSDQSGKGDT